MTFMRRFSKEHIKKIQTLPLWKNCLLEDIVGNTETKRSVFPAIRKDRIDFYWGGGELFSYVPQNESGFSTHHKYASVLYPTPNEQNGLYVSESALKQDFRLISDFVEGYARIKENCARYSGLEAQGVASLYERFSCAKKNESPVVVLDIEVALKKEPSLQTMDDTVIVNDGQRAGQDRIDLLLFCTQTKMLRFFEAKHFSYTSALRSKESGKEKVITQIKSYRNQLKREDKCKKILSEYKEHVKIINELFSTDLPYPEKIDREPKLLIFGFDSDQQQRLEKSTLNSLNGENVSSYAIGDITGCNIETLFKGGRQDWEGNIFTNPDSAPQ